MPRSLCSLAAALLALAPACRTPGNGTASAVLHEEDAPTRSGTSWQWEKTSEDEFRDVIIPFMELGGPTQILPAAHQLTQRAQFWIDRIDAYLREEYPDRLRFVPKPSAKVWKNADPNAFVSSVPVCLDVPIRFEAREHLTQTAAKAFLAPSGTIEPAPTKRCIQRAYTASTLGAFVSWYNQEHPSCTLRMEGAAGGTKELVAAENCRLGGTLERKAGAKRLVFYATSPAVVFHTGIFATYPDEAQFVATLAHELGHYYRAHPSASEEKYNYYYRLKEHSEAGRPTPDESLRAFGLSVNEASTILFANKKVEGQHYPSELFFGIWNLLLSAVGDGASGAKDCDRFRDFVTGDGESAFGDFPSESLHGNGLVAYRKWETLATACASKIALKDDEASKLALTREAVGVEFTGQDGRLGVLAQDLGDAQTLEQALKLLTARLEEARGPAREVLEKADAEDLGYYTMEQEADEQATEWLDALGFSPRHAADAYFSIGTWIYEHGHALEHTAVSMQDCRKLYDDGWRRPDGTIYVVPIADYQNEHHTPCYRIFNIDREIKAHSYRAADQSPPAPPAPAWADVRKSSEAFATGQDGGPKAAFP